MMNSIRAFANTQKEIVVLSAVKLRSKCPNLPHKVPPQKDHVTQIIAGQKEIRRPVRFQYGRVKALIRDFVFVRVNQIEFGIFLEQPYILKKSIRLKEIIVIEKRDPLAI